jgi:hypothetical protein
MKTMYYLLFHVDASRSIDAERSCVPSLTASEGPVSV